MKTIELTLPDYWASALINNDYSGLSQAERKEMDATMKMQGVKAGDCLTCSDDSFFAWHNDAAHGLGATCCKYTFRLPE